MKKYINIFIVIFYFGLVSCEKILNKDPIDKLSLEDLFKDISGAKTALSGAYRTLISTELYHENLMIYPELMGGNLKYSKTVNVQLDDVYNVDQIANSSSLNSTYSKLYDQLNNLNNIIKYTPSAIGLATEKNEILAEAKCLRALAHFDLLRVFSRPFNYKPDASHLGIVINLKPQLITDSSPIRSTSLVSYKAIIDDLNDAIILFDNSSTVFSKGSSQTFFSKKSAKALLAKVYLYTNDFDKAYELADDVIKNGGYTLISNAQYVNSWTGRTPSTESIFELALETNFSGNSLGSYYESTNLGGYRMFAATNDLLNLYTSTDVRGNSSLFTLVSISGSSYQFTKKYATGSTSATPVKILRLSEIYLIRAEAATEKTNSDFAQANTDLNVIAKRADLTATTVNYSTKSALINAILLERRKELAFEGNLAYDIIRKGQIIIRNDCSSKVCNLLSSDYRLVMPLPAETVNANRSMIQNEGY